MTTVLAVSIVAITIIAFIVTQVQLFREDRRDWAIFWAIVAWWIAFLWAAAHLILRSLA